MANILDRIRKPASGDAEKPADDRSGAPPVELDVPPPSPNANQPVFASETSNDSDALGIGPYVRRFAELAAHRQTQTPLTIGIFGGAGSGKSFAMNRLMADIRALAAAAASAKDSPYHGQVAAACVDANAGLAPSVAVAAAIHEALLAPSPHRDSFAAWAEDAAFSAGDPQQMVREASERISDLRRRHNTEKQSLLDIQSRRARLTENVLYDAAGTRIDTYARNNRSGIESRLAGFGFSDPDPVATYKDLVRDYTENSGSFRRIRVFFHSLWGYRGQMRLIILALFFVLLGWLIGELQAPSQWLRDRLQTMQESVTFLGGLTTWLEGNGGFLGTLKNAAYLAAAGALLINVFRAIRFLMPIRRGVALLNADVDSRRRDLDNLIASQSQRVEDLNTEIEKQGRILSEAERRADDSRDPAASARRSPFLSTGEGADGRARSFIQAIAADLGAGDRANAAKRIVLVIDNLDALPPRRAVDFLKEALALVSSSGFVSAAAIDPAHLKAGLREDAGEVSEAQLSDMIARMVQVPFRLDKRDADNFAQLVRALLGKEEQQAVPAPDAATSTLDEPMRPGEPELLAALSSIAGDTPRKVKRFVNTYRLARAGGDAFAPLALALAVQSGANEIEKRELATMLDGPAEVVLEPHDGDSRLGLALRAASAAQGTPLTAGHVTEAQKVAALYSDAY